MKSPPGRAIPTQPVMALSPTCEGREHVSSRRAPCANMNRRTVRAFNTCRTTQAKATRTTPNNHTEAIPQSACSDQASKTLK
eukprot:2437009-Alexandrium_andersonii.AAC.1